MIGAVRMTVGGFAQQISALTEYIEIIPMLVSSYHLKLWRLNIWALQQCWTVRLRKKQPIEYQSR